MDHVLFIQKVRPEKRDAYVKAHRKPPPELIDLIRESGVEREIIWMDEYTLYIYVMAEDFDMAMEFQKKNAVFKQWVKEMEPLLEKIQDYSEKGTVVQLEKVFDLEEHSGR
jgi:L-rhamnose mutarotase